MAASDSQTFSEKRVPSARSANVHSWVSDGIGLLLSAILLWLIFPQPGWSGLAFVALTPAVLVAVRGASLKRLVLLAYLVFFAWWLWMARWLIPITGLGYLALSAFLACYFTVALIVTRQLHRAWRIPLTLALPLGWTSLELLRGHWPAGGFGWFLLAHSQAALEESPRAPLLIQMADLFGQWGLSFILAMTSGLLADLLIQPIRRRQSDGRMGWNRGLLLLVLLNITILTGSLVYGYWRLNPDHLKAGRTLDPISLIQTYVPISNKVTPSPQQTAADWADMIRLTEQAIADTPKPWLIIWPETMVPWPIDADSQRYLQPKSGEPSSADYAQQIRRLASEHQVNLLVGASSWNWVPTGDGFVQVKGAWNSAYLFPARSQPSDWPTRYDKIHRVPFGEFVPWVEQWPWLRQKFIRWFTPYGFDYSLTAGTSTQPLRIALPEKQVGDSIRQTVRPDISAVAGGGGGSLGGAIGGGVPICFEDAVPEVCRSLVYDESGRKKADFLANLTNDGWYCYWDQPAQHLQLATLRCVELRTPMVRCVNTGISAAIDSNGRIIKRLVSQRGESGRLMIDSLATDERTTWYAYWGDWPAKLLAILTGLLALAGGGLGKKPPMRPTGRKESTK